MIPRTPYARKPGEHRRQLPGEVPAWIESLQTELEDLLGYYGVDHGAEPGYDNTQHPFSSLGSLGGLAAILGHGWTRAYPREVDPYNLPADGQDGQVARAKRSTNYGGPPIFVYDGAQGVWVAPADQTLTPDVVIDEGRMQVGDYIGPHLWNEAWQVLQAMHTTRWRPRHYTRERRVSLYPYDYANEIDAVNEALAQYAAESGPDFTNTLIADNDAGEGAAGMGCQSLYDSSGGGTLGGQFSAMVYSQQLDLRYRVYVVDDLDNTTRNVDWPFELRVYLRSYDGAMLDWNWGATHEPDKYYLQISDYGPATSRRHFFPEDYSITIDAWPEQPDDQDADETNVNWEAHTTSLVRFEFPHG